jgi:threonine/homoserine/homoserine lactone efflux protein
MPAELLVLASALWLGIVTSLSPCPLATNVAATSMLVRRVDTRYRALAGAAAYTLGRMSAYVALALVVFAGITTMPDLAAFARAWVLPLVGPLLVLVGMMVLGWLTLPFSFGGGGGKAAGKLADRGLAGEFGLGALFALSFCPVSAALFFGSLLPIAMVHAWPPGPVLMFGFGTALPVGIVAGLLVVSAHKAARTLNRLQGIQRVAMKLTGAILVGIGIWLTLRDTVGLIG